MKELVSPVESLGEAARTVSPERPWSEAAVEPEWRLDPLLDTATDVLGDLDLTNNAWMYADTVPYEHTWDPSHFSGVGDPVGEAEYWRLQNGNSCAVNAQISVIESITGVEIPEAEACGWLEDHGWYDPNGGTPLDDMDRLLDRQGIDSDTLHGATIDDLADALDRGDRVIVALNAQEIWDPLRSADTGEVIPQPGAYGHAVMITGIDQAEDGSFSVIMNDSGRPDGAMRAVALEDFLEAWNDYDNTLIVAKGGADAAGS